MENILVSDILRKNTDTIWTSPQYHGGTYKGKIRSVVILFAHRLFFRSLISTVLLEIHLISGTIFSLMYIEHITIGGLILSENANYRIWGLSIDRVQSS